MTAFPRQVDIKRAIRAAIAAGMAPGSFTVEIGDGSIRLLPANESRADAINDDQDWTDLAGETQAARRA